MFYRYDMISDYMRSAKIKWLRAGYGDADGNNLPGGPARLSGFYIVPLCSFGCCGLGRPYRTKKDALRAVKLRYGPFRRTVGYPSWRRVKRFWPVRSSKKWDDEGLCHFVWNPKHRKRGASESEYAGRWPWRR